MKTSTQKGSARFAGLFLLALLVFALAVAAAQAFPSQGSTLVRLAQAHHDRDLQTAAVSGTSNIAKRPTLAQFQRAHGDNRGPSGVSGGGAAIAAQPASSGISSTTVSIAVGAAVAVLIIALVAWTLIRRRRQPSVPESSAYCALHPGDSRCGAG